MKFNIKVWDKSEDYQWSFFHGVVAGLILVAIATSIVLIFF